MADSNKDNSAEPKCCFSPDLLNPDRTHTPQPYAPWYPHSHAHSPSPSHTHSLACCSAPTLPYLTAKPYAPTGFFVFTLRQWRSLNIVAVVVAGAVVAVADVVVVAVCTCHVLPVCLCVCVWASSE